MRQCAGFIGNLNADDIGFPRRKSGLLEQLHRPFRLIGNHAQDAELGGIGNRNGTQVDLCFGQQVGHPRQPTGGILHEDGNLLDNHPEPSLLKHSLVDDALGLPLTALDRARLNQFDMRADTQFAAQFAVNAFA